MQGGFGNFDSVLIQSTVMRSPGNVHLLTFLPSSSSYIAAMPPPAYYHGHPVPASQDEPSETIETAPPVPPSNLERPSDCINKYSTPPFALLCTMMDRMRSEEASKRRDTLIRFMDLWRIKVGNDMYPLIRLLLPDVGWVTGRKSADGDRGIVKDQCII